MSDHDWLESAGPYALGALDAQEHARFEAHLAGCAACRAEVRAVQETVGQLVHAAPLPAAPPPPRLRERVLAEARRVRPLHPRRAWLSAAAAAALAIALGMGYVAERRARVAFETELALARAGLAERDSLLATVLASDVATADLAGTGRPPSARLFWNRPRGVVVVTVFDLPPAPAGRAYQLWGIETGKTPVSLGVFDTPAGRATVVRSVPSGLRLDIAAVTQEPAGGSPQPTQAPFLVGQLRRSE